ncbi:hypothetical protein HWV62_5053 [Athelia sp. TMB]|nr:hypothetical protein HWV62_23563 [Athelia sp. TMB]KAF7976975.1 hypothetical protein HWV62_5053 [Athelia sp. TMB]
MDDQSTKDSFACWDGFDVMFDRAMAPGTTTDHDSPSRSPSTYERPPSMTPSRPNPQQDSSEDSMGPLTPVDRDYESLGQLWDTLREKKARQMAKETPKVKSLEEVGVGSTSREYERESLPMSPPRGMGQSQQLYHDRERPAMAPASPRSEDILKQDPKGQPKLKKRKSIATLRESHDGRMITATFDLPGIKKNQVHVSYRGHYLIVDWETVKVTEHEENGKIIREHKEKKYSRTLPMPEGTRFEEVRASMDGRHLILIYPNMRPMRVEPRRTVTDPM